MGPWREQQGGGCRVIAGAAGGAVAGFAIAAIVDLTVCVIVNKAKKEELQEAIIKAARRRGDLARLEYSLRQIQQVISMLSDRLDIFLRDDAISMYDPAWNKKIEDILTEHSALLQSYATSLEAAVINELINQDKARNSWIAEDPSDHRIFSPNSEEFACWFFNNNGNNNVNRPIDSSSCRNARPTL